MVSYFDSVVSLWETYTDVKAKGDNTVPQYMQLEEDYVGQLYLLEVICSLYDFPIDLEPVKRKAEE